MQRNPRFLVFYRAGESNYAFDRGGLDDKDIKHSSGPAPSRGPSCAGICFMSSIYFRNMIHVSIGRRSRSPLSPLSFRIMSRADLMRLPSCCAVVSGWESFLARAINQSQMTNFKFQMRSLSGILRLQITNLKLRMTDQVPYWEWNNSN